MKKWCQVIRSAAPVTQNHLSKPEDLMLQNANPLRKSAPGPPNSSDEHVSCTAPATQNAPCRSSSNVPRLPSFLEMLQNPHDLLTFDKVHNPLRLPRKTNVQKWCERVVFCTFWLRNVLRATTAYTFSTSQLLKVLRSWGVLYISRHNGVQFFISHLASGATNHWKNTVFRDFPTFSRTWIFFLLRLYLFDLLSSSLLFSSLTLPISAFHLSILSEVWLLNFLRLWHPMTLFASFTLSFKTQLSFVVCINVLAQLSPSDFLDCWNVHYLKFRIMDNLIQFTYRMIA